MATKKELEARIEALEAEVALLRARPAYPVIGPVLPQPAPWSPTWTPGTIWCGAGQITSDPNAPKYTINAGACP